MLTSQECCHYFDEEPVHSFFTVGVKPGPERFNLVNPKMDMPVTARAPTLVVPANQSNSPFVKLLSKRSWLVKPLLWAIAVQAYLALILGHSLTAHC